MSEQIQTIKLKISFDGWHCLTKKQTQDILKKARNIFFNANFVDNVGLLIENDNEIEIFNFCLDIIKVYEKNLGNWNGYEIKKISKKILINFADRKRKLSFDFFEKILKENKIEDCKIVLAGNLYLNPNDVEDLLLSIERDFNCKLNQMNNEELQDAYRILLMYSSSKNRTFSINK